MADDSHEETLYWLQQEINGAVALIALAFLFTGLNLLAFRAREQRKATQWWTSGLVVASLLAFLALCVAAIVNARGYKHFYQTDSEDGQSADYVVTAKSSYAMSVAYPISCALPKLLLCILYLQIFYINRSVRHITYGLIAFLIMNAVAWLVPAIIVCQPISFFWNVEDGQGKCLNYNIFGTWISLPNIVSDLVMLVLPVPVVLKTQMSIAKKLGLILTFAAGCGGMVGGCLRLGFYVHRTYVERPGVDQSTKSIALDVIVTYIECGLYLITSCLPTLRILVVRCHSILKSSIGSLIKKYQNSDYSGETASGNHKKSTSDDQRRLNVKLTGMGNLNTLVHDSSRVDRGRVDSVLDPCDPIGRY